MTNTETVVDAMAVAFTHIENEYLAALALRHENFPDFDGFVTPELERDPKWAYPQGAIEALEEVMHRIAPDRCWAAEVLMREGLA